MPRNDHQHNWQDCGPSMPGGWRYRCTVCGSKSRNGLSGRPVRVRSTYMNFITGEVKVFDWEIGGKKEPMPSQPRLIPEEG